jgi:hypothetical protein
LGSADRRLSVHRKLRQWQARRPSRDPLAAALTHRGIGGTLDQAQKNTPLRGISGVSAVDAIGCIDGIGRPHGPSRGLNTSGSADADVGAL